MNVILSRYEIRKAIQEYVEKTTGLKVTKFPALYEATKDKSTYAEIEVEPKEQK